MKRTLIFDDSVKGHHLEYIHHLYCGAVSDIEGKYIFILNPDFKKVSNKFNWPQCSNITIFYLSDKDIVNLNKEGLIKSFYLCKVLKEVIIKYNVDRVFLISLMAFMPFLPFFVNKKIKISGIVYLIYLYRWKNASFQVRLLDVIKYLIFANIKKFEKIYLLNDRIAPVYLNKKFKTNVFSYLPDPFTPLSIEKNRNLRNELNIPVEKIICIHFGALTARKGTLELMQAITLAQESALNKCCFIFAGEIYNDIKKSFYQLAKQAEKMTQIIIIDQFCDYEFIGSLCLTSDFILIPYKDSEQSSGVIGYAAQFGIPVVGPGWGLLGKLIKRNNLGFLLKNTSAFEITNFINNIERFSFSTKTNYIQNNTVIQFTNTIFK